MADADREAGPPAVVPHQPPDLGALRAAVIARSEQRPGCCTPGSDPGAQGVRLGRQQGIARGLGAFQAPDVERGVLSGTPGEWQKCKFLGRECALNFHYCHGVQLSCRSSRSKEAGFGSAQPAVIHQAKHGPVARAFDYRNNASICCSDKS